MLHVIYLRLLCEDNLDLSPEMQVPTVTNRLLNNHTTTSCLVRKVTPHGHHVRRHFTSTASTSSAPAERLVAINLLSFPSLRRPPKTPSYCCPEFSVQHNLRRRRSLVLSRPQPQPRSTPTTPTPTPIIARRQRSNDTKIQQQQYISLQR